MGLNVLLAMKMVQQHQQKDMIVAWARRGVFFHLDCVCVPCQAAEGGGSKEGRAGADAPAAAEGAVSDCGREGGAEGREAGQGERPAGSHAAAGGTEEWAAGSTGAVPGTRSNVWVKILHRLYGPSAKVRLKPDDWH